MYGLSGSNMAIGVSLVLHDRFTGRARAAAASLNQLDKQARAAQMRQLEMQRNVNAVGAGIGAMAISGMYQWGKVGAEFGHTMNYVNTIAEKKGAVGLGKLSDRAKTLGADTMFSARQVADGMKYMAMAGQDTESIYNNINAAVSLAGATMSRLEGKGGSADILTNIMRGFDIEGTEKNSMRVADVLTTATTSANTSLWDLHEAMKYSMSTAKDLGVTLEETASMAMMAGDAGIQGSMAGTAVENMLRYITRAADETRKGRSGDALRKLGLSPEDLQDAQGNLMAMSPMLNVISKQIQGMGNVQSQNILTDLFGVRGKREASLLLRNMQDYDKYVDKMNSQSTGRATSNLESQMSTLQGVGIQLASSWESLKIAFTESIQPVVIPLIKGITFLVKGLTAMVETPVGAFLTAMGAGAVVVKTALMGYRAVVAGLRLYHMQMGTSFTASASKIVGGYNSMTNAAHRYSAASGAYGGIMPGGGRWGRTLAKRGIGTYTGQTKRGAQYSTHGKGTTFIPKGSKPNGWSIGAGTTLGKAGKFIGKASVPAMIGGMALSMGGDAMGGTAGKYMSMGGDAIGWAGTGAMLGSVVPGIGTAAGAIVGGVGSLLWSLYDDMEKVDDEVKKAKASKSEFNAEAWRIKAEKLQTMFEGDVIYGRKGPADDQMMATDKAGANAYLNQVNEKDTRITINIDGKKAMDKVVKENTYKTLIDLAAF